jgi:hypothetical protein
LSSYLVQLAIGLMLFLLAVVLIYATSVLSVEEERVRDRSFPVGGIAGLADSYPKIIGAVVVGGGLAGAIEYVAHRMILQLPMRHALHALMDGATIAVATGAMIGIFLVAVGAHRREVNERLAKIATLSGRVKSALQVITHAEYLGHSGYATEVLASVEEINGIINELSPAAHPQVGARVRQILNEQSRVNLTRHDSEERLFKERNEQPQGEDRKNSA